MRVWSRRTVLSVVAGGKPRAWVPLAVAGAPLRRTFVAMKCDKPARPPGVMFCVGIATAAFGAAMVLRFRPS